MSEKCPLISTDIDLYTWTELYESYLLYKDLDDRELTTDGRQLRDRLRRLFDHTPPTARSRQLVQ